MNYIVLIITLVFLANQIRIAKNKKAYVLFYILGVYFFSVLYAITLIEKQSGNFSISIISGIVFCLFLLFYFKPFNWNTPKIIGRNDKEFIKRFCRISYFLSFLLILGGILLFSKIQEVSKFGFAAARAAGYIQSDELTSFTSSQHIGHSILRWASGLSYVLIFMFFYSISFFSKRYILKILLFIASLSAPYFGLASAGRTRIIYWILFYLLSYILFNKYLSQRVRNTIKLISITIFSIVLILFIIITIDRASLIGTSSSDFLGSYIGQPIINFCYYFDNFNYAQFKLHRILPFTSTIFYGRFNLTAYREEVEANSGFLINGFNTMIGDLYIDVGFIGMLLFSMIFYRLARYVYRRQSFNFYYLLFFAVIVQVPLHGIFYYSLWQIESSVCSIFSLIIGKYITNSKYER